MGRRITSSALEFISDLMKCGWRLYFSDKPDQSGRPFCFVQSKKEGKHVCRNDIACTLANFAGATIDRALCYPEQAHGNSRAACGSPDLDRPIVAVFNPDSAVADDSESEAQAFCSKAKPFGIANGKSQIPKYGICNLRSEIPSASEDSLRHAYASLAVAQV
jgi:hypothetical protein